MHKFTIIACVRNEESTVFKSKARPDDRVRDYLRGMYIFLDGPTSKTARKAWTIWAML